MNNTTSKRHIGFLAENLACEYLEKKGLTLLTRNYYSHCGEVDLIMKENKMYVFVEVKKRTRTHYGTPIESVTWQKQQKLIKTATLYMVKHNIYNKAPCRFDIVGVKICQGKPDISWLKNAFEESS